MDDVTIQQVFALAAKTVRKRTTAGKKPIAEGDFSWLLPVTVKVLNSYWTTKFKKDCKQAMKRHMDIGLPDDMIRALSRGEQLPEKNKERVMRTLQRYFLYFMMYSMIGWCYEVFLEVVVYRWGFSNRGVLYGPYCVIYGFGALILLFSLSGLKRKSIPFGKWNAAPVLVFLGIVVITTVVELIGSYIMEASQGEWMWDYTNFAFNFQGRIAPNPSIRFGIGGMIFLYLLQPLFEKSVRKMSDTVLTIVSAAAAALLCLDVLYTFVLL